MTHVLNKECERTICWQCCGDRNTLVQQCLTFFTRHRRVCVWKYKPNGFTTNQYLDSMTTAALWYAPAKKLLFPEPLRPTTTLCLGENGSICVWSRSPRIKPDLVSCIKWNACQWLTRFETLNGKSFDVHDGRESGRSVESEFVCVLCTTMWCIVY